MKKILWQIGLIFLLSTNFANAINIEYNNPIFDDINQFLDNWDIEPWYNPQPSYRIGVYEPYIDNWDDEATAIEYCTLKSETFVNYILETDSVFQNSALYFPPNSTWWDYNINIRQFSLITCDDWQTEPENNSGSWTVIVNNINEYEGINKKIFDDDTIIEIYKYEALMMVFILLYTFFMRTIWRKTKSKPFNF
jgi:hypothetical protein